MLKQLITLLFISVFIAACSDNGSSSDSAAPVTQPPPPPANTTSYSIELTPLQVIGNNDSNTSAVTTTATATASLTIDEDDNSLTGSITGLTADTVSLRAGFAGETGDLLFDLDADGNNQWSIPPNTVLSQGELDQFNEGSLFLQASTTAQPQGILRGQILINDVNLLRVELAAIQTVSLVSSTAIGTGYVTYDSVTGDAIAHVNGVGIDDAVAAHIHNAIAGVNGPVELGLTKDTGDLGHWFSDSVILDQGQMDKLNSAELYFNIHTPANPSGEIRGQIIPDNIEVIFTELSGDSVVTAGSGGVTTTARGVAATTLLAATQTATTIINTSAIDDASSATLNQAPAGQNGPSIVDFTQDSVDLFRWTAENFAFNTVQFTALANQGLYFSITSPAQPNGELRGQLISNTSNQAPTNSALQISSTDPASGTLLAALPTTISLTFNRDILASSVSSGVITLTASGDDASFGEANDVVITGITSSVSNNIVSLDLIGIVVSDDVFQISIADNSITDLEGIILDGDNDGNAGGVFTSNFNVETPSTATLSNIQSSVFTPTCSGCHGGATPSAGLNLSAGQTFSNTVNVNSVEVGSLLRIAPNDPDNSYLVQKVEGSAAVGARMPLGGAPLDSALIQTIRQWISEGALDN